MQTPDLTAETIDEKFKISIRTRDEQVRKKLREARWDLQFVFLSFNTRSASRPCQRGSKHRP